MHIRDICTSQAAHCTRDETVQGAALTMRRLHVGDVIVVDQLDGANVPVGIVSADDLLEFLAEEMGELSRISPYQQAHERRARQ